MAAKEDSELSQVKVSIVYKLLILLLCIVYIIFRGRLAKNQLS